MDDLKETVIKFMEYNGIRRNSHSYDVYEITKIWLGTLDLDPIQWHDACQIVAEYLGIDSNGNL
jgi:hypothetical protein